MNVQNNVIDTNQLMEPECKVSPNNNTFKQYRKKLENKKPMKCK